MVPAGLCSCRGMLVPEQKYIFLFLGELQAGNALEMVYSATAATGDICEERREYAAVGDGCWRVEARGTSSVYY